MGKKRNKKLKLDTERINDEIKASKVRCVGENIPHNTDNGIIMLSELKKFANEINLDIVEINPNTKPIIVKIMDYSKFLYEKKRKLKDASKNTTTVKEIKLSAFIGDADYTRKIEQARKFLKNGDKVKISGFAKGRTASDMGDKLVELALKMVIELEDAGIVETIPKMQGRRLTGMVKPLKKKN